MSKYSYQGDGFKRPDSTQASSNKSIKRGFSRSVSEKITHYDSSLATLRLEIKDTESTSGKTTINSQGCPGLIEKNANIDSQDSIWYKNLMSPVYKILNCSVDKGEETFSEKRETPSDAENTKLGKSENYEEGFRAFKKEVLEYGSKCYSIDSSLEPRRIKEAYQMYLKARRGTELKFLVLGRKYRDQDRNLLPSNEHSPSIDSPMIENLGNINEDFYKKNGSVFSYPYDDWTLITQDACILGLIQAKTEFHIISPINMNNLWKADHECMTIFAREIKAITSFGYNLYKTQFEVVACCFDKEKAERSSLQKLIEKTQDIYDYENLKKFFESLPDEVKSEE